MPTFIGHSLVGLSICAPLQRTSLGQAMGFYAWAMVLVIAGNMPDLDLLLWRWFPYSHPLGHRGFSHSIFFALAMALVITLSGYFAGIIRGKIFTLILVWLIIALAMASHGLLDAMTDGGSGVGLFSPVSFRRYFFFIRPLPVAWLGVSGMFSSYMLHVYFVELALFGTFCLAAWLGSADFPATSVWSTFKWVTVGGLFILGMGAWVARVSSL